MSVHVHIHLSYSPVPDSNSPFTCGGGEPQIKCVGVFADYNHRSRWGAEGEARWLRWDEVQD